MQAKPELNQSIGYCISCYQINSRQARGVASAIQGCTALLLSHLELLFLLFPTEGSLHRSCTKKIQGSQQHQLPLCLP